jgi:hypothetical protein
MLLRTIFAVMFARLCHEADGELEQIQFLLGRERPNNRAMSLDLKQRLRNAVKDNIGLEPATSLTGKRHAGPFLIRTR